MNIHTQVFLDIHITFILDGAHVLTVISLWPVCGLHLHDSDSNSLQRELRCLPAPSASWMSTSCSPSHLGTFVDIGSKSSVLGTFCRLFSEWVIVGRVHFHLCQCWWFSLKTSHGSFSLLLVYSLSLVSPSSFCSPLVLTCLPLIHFFLRLVNIQVFFYQLRLRVVVCLLGGTYCMFH